MDRIPQDSDAPGSERTSRKLRIFLAIPTGKVCDSVQEALDPGSCEVTWCQSGSDAVILLAQKTFDLLICSSILTDMHALDLIVKLGEERIAIPVVLLSWPDDCRAPSAPFGPVCDIIPLSASFLEDLPARIEQALTRHQAEKAKDLWLAALEATQDGIAIIEIQGTVVHVNRALETITGYSREELEGHDWRMLRADVSDSGAFRSFMRSMRRRSRWGGDITFRRRDGLLVVVSVTMAPVLDAAGRITHVVGIARDTSESRRKEAHLLHLHKMESAGTLAGGVAHEFNNLLTGIMGYATLAMRREDVPASVRELLEQVILLGDRAASLTQQMLAFSRKRMVRGELVAVADVLRRASNRIRARVDKVVDVEGLEQVEPLMIRADSDQLEQALLELVHNAQVASGGPEPIAIRAWAETCSSSHAGVPDLVPQGDYVCLEVTDHGCGMSEEVRRRATDPFFTTRPAGQGTGLGLSMVAAAVHSHRGYLTIDSEPGMGTSVRIYLPRPRQGSEKTAVLDHMIEPELERSARILIQDDEPAILDALQRYLAEAGYLVVTSRDTHAMLETALAGQGFDLAILDLAPTGDEAPVDLAELAARCPDLPIIFCPGQACPDLGPNWRAKGHRLLRKPYRMNELGFAVQETLLDRQARPRTTGHSQS